MENKTKKRILNLGCGNDTYGTDRLDVKKTNTTTIVHNLNESLPYKNETFDEVKAHAIISHVKCPHLLAQEMYRILKAGGHLDLTTDNAGYIIFHIKNDHNAYLERDDYMKTRHPEDYHRQFFVPSHLHAMFRKFSIVVIKPFVRNRTGWKKWILQILPYNLGCEALHLHAIK